MYRADKKNKRDIRYILNNLRDEDKKEVKITFGKKWKRIVLKTLLTSKYLYLLGKTKQKNNPVLICGAWAVDKKNPSIAAIWMLSTKEIVNHQVTFLREMKKELQKYDEEFAITYNQIYKSNELAKKWLKWAGYRFPNDEKKLTPIDHVFLSIRVPKDFEIFYRERCVKGLGE